MEEKDRRTAAVATGEVSCKNTHTRPAFLSNSPNYCREEEGRGGEMDGVCSCVCVCVCVWPGVRLISFTGLDKISLSDTLSHTHTHTLARRSLKYLLASCGEISRDYPQ